MMLDAKQQFEENISRAKEMGGLYLAICTLMTSAVDATDLLRAQYVLVVSALDHYVHQLVREGMLEIHDGRRPSTRAFANFKLPMDAVQNSIKTSQFRDVFEAEIRKQHSYQAFQQPDRIAEAVRLFSDVKLWTAVGSYISEDVAQLKNHLRLIVDRRNKIAHEADLDPTYPNVRWSITHAEVSGAISTIERIVTGIHFSI